MGILDSVGASAVGAWSTARLLRAAYAGKCINISRNSDSTNTDIGFVGALVDTAAIAAFCAGTTGHVQVIYDQSGNGRDLSVANGGGGITGGPVIYASGALVTINGKAAFGGGGSNLFAATSGVAWGTVMAGAGCLLRAFRDDGSINDFTFVWPPADGDSHNYLGGTTYWGEWLAARGAGNIGFVNNATHVVMNQYDGASNYVMRRNGVQLLSESAATAGAFAPTGAGTTFYPTVSGAAGLSGGEVIIWNAYLTGGQIATAEADQIAFWITAAVDKSTADAPAVSVTEGRAIAPSVRTVDSPFPIRGGANAGTSSFSAVIDGGAAGSSFADVIDGGNAASTYGGVTVSIGEARAIAGSTHTADAPATAISEASQRTRPFSTGDAPAAAISEAKAISRIVRTGDPVGLSIGESFHNFGIANRSDIFVIGVSEISRTAHPVASADSMLTACVEAQGVAKRQGIYTVVDCVAFF